MENGQRFSMRAFVSIVMLFSGLGLPFTGIANHFQQFDAMNTSRHAWMAAHNSLGLVFVIFSLWHVVLNRKAILNHLRGIRVGISALSREAFMAASVVAVVLFVFVGHAFHVK